MDWVGKHLSTLHMFKHKAQGWAAFHTSRGSHQTALQLLMNDWSGSAVGTLIAQLSLEQHRISNAVPASVTL